LQKQETFLTFIYKTDYLSNSPESTNFSSSLMQHQNKLECFYPPYSSTYLQNCDPSLLVLLLQNRLTMVANDKHSSLFSQIVSDKEERLKTWTPAWGKFVGNPEEGMANFQPVLSLGSGREPESCSGQVFNFKLGCFCFGIHIHTHIYN